jgi:hypothetical protein
VVTVVQLPHSKEEETDDPITKEQVEEDVEPASKRPKIEGTFPGISPWCDLSSISQAKNSDE